MLDALRQTHPEINTVSLEENQAAVEAMQSDNPVPSRDIYHKSPEQLYLNKERLLALYDAMNRSSLRDAHGFAIGLVSMANRAHWQQRRGTTG